MQETYDLVSRYMSRPAEQLYDTAADPYELEDLAEQKQLASTKARLKTELERWLAAQGDPGVEQDTMDAIQAARDGKHKFGPFISNP